MERSAGAVIRNTEGKYLLVKGRNGTWGFPKGHVEAHETHVQTALREIKEEVGLTVTIDETQKCYIKYPIGNGVEKEVIYFIAKVNNSKVILNEEILEYNWLERDDILNSITHENLKTAFITLTRGA